MPANHRRRLHDHQRAAPIEAPGQYRQADAGSRVDPARSDTALDVQSQLPAQEEILGAQRLGGPKQQQQPPEGIFDEKTCDPQEADMRSSCHSDRPEPAVTARPRADGIFAEHNGSVAARTALQTKLSPLVGFPRSGTCAARHGLPARSFDTRRCAPGATSHAGLARIAAT
jgi:hypothetical protein